MGLKTISTKEAVPGMIVAQDIYTFNNQLLINSRTLLTDRIITRLKFYSITEIEIIEDDDASSDTDISNDKAEAKEDKEDKVIFSSKFAQAGTTANTVFLSHIDEVKSSEEFKKFNASYDEFSQEFENSLKDVVGKGKDINTAKLLMQVNSVLKESRTSLHLLDMMNCLRNHSDSVYKHSINVALICNVMAKWLNFSESEAATLTLCGLLHDIGKIEIPSDILDKPGALTEEEYRLVKTHTTKGYQILKNKNVDNHIKYSALMHHERCDGSGYPNQYLGRSIDNYAMIVAIADTYDAMTCARPYRGPLCPFEVIEFFEFEGLQKFNPKYILTFLNGIVQTYQGNTVVLSNGQQGTILMLNKNYLSRPVISVGTKYIDLASRNDINISKVI